MSSRFLPHDWFPEPVPVNVELGSRSWLYSTYAFRHYRSERPVGLRVGHDTGLYNGTFFDVGPEAEVEIGNYCTVVGAIFCTNGRIEIGDYALISHEVVIADHFAPIPPECGAVGAPDASGTLVSIGENVWIGARAVLVGPVTVGPGAVVGAGAVVTGEVPPLAIVAGNPAQVVGRANERHGKGTP